jgi:hypothetical protein
MAGISRSGDAAPVWLSDENGNVLGGTANPLNVSSAGGGGGGGGVVTQPTASQLNAQVVGNVASGVADAGNPIKIGGVANTAAPGSFPNGTRTDTWANAQGAIVVAGFSTSGADGILNNAVVSMPGSQAIGSARLFLTAGSVFNGTTFDRQRGDTNGTFSVSKGSGTIATAQVSVATSSTQVVAARAGRGSVKITNLGTTDVFVGVTGVTTTTGDLLPGTKGASITIPTNAAVFAVASGAAQTVSVMEVY